MSQLSTLTLIVLLLAGCVAPGQEQGAGTRAAPVATPAYAYAPAGEVEVSAAQREQWLAKTDPQALDVLRFWFEEWDQDLSNGGKGRYNDKWFPHGPLGAAGSKEIDREIRQRYQGLFEQVVNAELPWQVDTNPYENLAYILLIDQFARNMFRGTPQSYEHDALALDAARVNVEKGFHRYYFTGYQRLFVVYPLMHDESLDSQERCLYLLKSINEESDYAYQFLNAMQKGAEHYQMIFMFGRFPHRNERLQREPTKQELTYLEMKGTAGFVDGSKW